MTPAFLDHESIDLERLFDRYGDHPALVMPAGIRTFGEIRERLRIVTENLRQAGVSRGDLVALHEENGELHLYLFLAAWLLGFLYLPLDFKSPSRSLLDIAPWTFLITSGDVPPCGGRTVLHPEKILQRPASLEKSSRWPAIPFQQEACVIFTSGSTGNPRGIVHTVGGTVYSALGTNACIGVEPADCWLLSLPLYHIGGVMIWVRTLLSGSACLLPDGLKRIDEAVLRHAPTILSLVPTQLIRFLASDALIRVLQKSKTILLGGAPSPGWLIEKALNLGIPVMPSYGSTESCAQVTGVVKGADRNAYQTAGRPLAYREVRIGEDGSILVGGKTLFCRYLDDFTENHAETEGFFKTADAGHFDPQGNLVVLGRKDGIFISGGENISPFEIENALLSLDSVATAIVVPVTHPEFGKVPWAFIERSGAWNEREIMTALKERLPGYKVPKRILPLERQDRKGKMKFSRESLKRLAEELAGREGADSR